MTTGVTAQTGVLGKAIVDDVAIARITQWSVNTTVGESAWGDSDCGAFTVRKAARKDATGTVTGKFDTGTPTYTLFQSGDIVKLVLWENAADYWAFPSALIQSYTETVDVDTKEAIEWSATFGADGVYFRPGEAGAPVETLP